MKPAPEGWPVPEDRRSPLERAAEALERAERSAADSTPSMAQAWAAIGAAWAGVAQAGQLHLLAQTGEHQALTALNAAGLLKGEGIQAMEALEQRIREGLGL